MRKILRLILAFVLIFILSLFILSISNKYIMGCAITGTNSMAPTIEQNEICFYKQINDKSNIDYGDIIITNIAYQLNETSKDDDYNDGMLMFFKSVLEYIGIPIACNVERVLALPGDSLKIENGLVYVNGYLVEENYIFSDIDTSISYKEFILGDGQYFSLPDNRENAKYDYVNYDNIEGIIIFK